MRKSRQPGFDKMLEAKREKAKTIMGQFVQHCDTCNVVSSKAKLFDLDEGRFCLNCLPEGMTGLDALDIHTARQAKLKEERENPVRPEHFGGWA